MKYSKKKHQKAIDEMLKQLTTVFEYEQLRGNEDQFIIWVAKKKGEMNIAISTDLYQLAHHAARVYKEKNK